jgi:hypothetical protein
MDWNATYIRKKPDTELRISQLMLVWFLWSKVHSKLIYSIYVLILVDQLWARQFIKKHLRIKLICQTPVLGIITFCVITKNPGIPGSSKPHKHGKPPIHTGFSMPRIFFDWYLFILISAVKNALIVRTYPYPDGWGRIWLPKLWTVM